MDDAFAAPQFGPLSQPAPQLLSPRDPDSAPVVASSKRKERSTSARQTGALLFLLLFFLMVLFGPFLVRRFVYRRAFRAAGWVSRLLKVAR